jgi:hypothetical protein
MTRRTRKRWVGVCLLGAALGAGGCSVEITRQAPADFAAGGCEACATQDDRRILPVSPKAAADLPGDDDPAAPPGDGAARGTPAVLTSIAPVSASAPDEGRPPAGPAAPEPAKPPEVLKLPDAAKLPNLGQVPGAANAVQLVSAVQPAPANDLAPAKPRRKKKRPVLGFDASAAEPVAAARPTLLAPEFAGQATASRKGYVDLTVQPWFGHADDHSWLNGQALYSRAQDTWRLHYASVDDADPYGGTVTLVGEERLKGLKDGAYVKVHGSLVEPDRHEAGSPYRVDSFEVVGRPK